MGKAGAQQHKKRCKIKKSGRGLQSMAADQLCITPWSHWLIWERLLAAQLSPSLSLRLPPPPPHPPTTPTKLSWSRFPLGPTESDGGKHGAQVHHGSVGAFTAGVFLTWMSAIPHIFEPKLQIKSKERGREILEMEQWSRVGELSFDPINLSETPKHFLFPANLRVCFKKKDTFYNIYSVT